VASAARNTRSIAAPDAQLGRSRPELRDKSSADRDPQSLAGLGATLHGRRVAWEIASERSAMHT
jgi:hypothetical protein